MGRGSLQDEGVGSVDFAVSCEIRHGGQTVLTFSDNSTALLLITLVTTILQTASSETEKIVLYRFLAEASVEMPEVVAMAYVYLIC